MLTPEGPWKFSAFCKYASNVMLPVVGALIEPTIPVLQCVCGMSCLQKNQIGSEALVIVKFHVGKPLEVPIGIRILPESNPFPRGSHGTSNDD